MMESRQDAPAPQPAARGAKLRSVWAQLQCRRLLRRHRFRRRTQHRVSALSHTLLASPAAQAVGDGLYALGFAAEYAVVRAARKVQGAGRWLAVWLLKLIHDLTATAFPGAAQVFHDIFDPFLLTLRGCWALLRHTNRIRRQHGPVAALRSSVQFLTGGIRRNLGLLPRMTMYLLPLCALALGVAVCRRTIDRPYALAVQVNGETVGYVANEATFNLAREDVQERLSYAGTDKTTWSIEPTYTISVSHKVLDENEMADAILRSASDEISEGTALYLDGELTAICADGSKLYQYLDDLAEPYEELNDPYMTVSFSKEVELENGIYFNESFQDFSEIEKTLSGVQQAQKVYTVQAGDTLWGIAQKNDLTFKELCALNPNFKGAPLTETSSIREGDELIITKQEAMLEVRIIKLETRQEEIPYSTETTRSNEYTQGTTKTLQEGVNGLKNVTYRNVYDTVGTLLEQSIVSTEILREPVSKKVVVGTKNITTSTKFITGSGQFIWPVPLYRYCSRWYYTGHKGVDICAPAGTPIYASAAGTVTKAGYNRAGAGSNYGYSLIINHGGGYSTVYAHCISLAVSAGQYVQQGQLVGYVGSTGRSSGNHCHFEIRYNGSYIPPQDVFGRSNYRNTP